ncbi:MAG TPA: aminotransferase class V-fold PLP-dependent enzyme, partial [Allosphingosinicella sp.]
MREPVYLDYQATTPLAPEAAAAMRPWLEDRFANPHSSHRLGREAAAVVEVARGRVLEALQIPLPARSEGASPEESLPAETDPPLTPPCIQGGELYFTSGATEAINWALKGAAARLPESRRRIVTLATEHAAVLDTVEYLASLGFDSE